jgi:hypothetical protein
MPAPQLRSYRCYTVCVIKKAAQSCAAPDFSFFFFYFLNVSRNRERVFESRMRFLTSPSAMATFGFVGSCDTEVLRMNARPAISPTPRVFVLVMIVFISILTIWGLHICYDYLCALSNKKPSHGWFFVCLLGATALSTFLTLLVFVPAVRTSSFFIHGIILQVNAHNTTM